MHRLLERPLTRVAAYEAAALELQLEASGGIMRVQAKVLLKTQSRLGELQARVEAEAEELKRRQQNKSTGWHV